MRYPLVVFAAILVAVVIMNIWVIPTFADAFARYNAELPLMTRTLIGSSEFFVAYWPWLLVALVTAVYSFRTWTRTHTGKLAWSAYLLRAPLVGAIIRKAVLALGVFLPLWDLSSAARGG